MSLTMNDKRVLRLIKVGAENSITGAEISLMTKLAERTVQGHYQPSNHALRCSYHRGTSRSFQRLLYPS